MTGWIVETLVASSLLMVILLLVRGQVARTFGPRIAYLLWLLPALRMVLPPLPQTLIEPPLEHLPVLVHIVTFDAGAAAPVAAAAAAAAPQTVAPASPALLTSLLDITRALPWAEILLTAWLGGALIHFGWHMLAYRAFVRRTIARATPQPRLDRDGIEVWSSRDVEGPLAAGVFVKTIVLPHDWRWRYTEEELRLALRHEFIHHLRWDMSANFAALAMLSLHWFNPIAHRAWRAFRADQELACDALVLADATASERHSYGLAVVKSACSRTPVAACTLGNRDELKRRLRMMQSGKLSLRRSVSGAVMAIALVGGGLALTASGGAAAEAATDMVAPIKTAWTVPPEPPAAPAAPEAAEPPAAPEAPEAWAAPAPISEPAPVPAPRQVVQAANGDKDEWSDAEWGAAAADAADSAADIADAAAERAGARAERDAERAAARAERAVALAEARAERSAALAEARADRAAALAEARAARQVAVAARHNHVISVNMQCNSKRDRVSETAISTASDGDAQRSSVRICTKAPDAKEVRRITIQALEKARASLARSQNLRQDQLASALAGMDAELAKLRAFTPR